VRLKAQTGLQHATGPIAQLEAIKVQRPRPTRPPALRPSRSATVAHEPEMLSGARARPGWAVCSTRARAASRTPRRFTIHHALVVPATQGSRLSR